MRRIEDVILKDGRSLKEVLESHYKWLENKKGGEKADLSNEDLSDVDLSNLNLRYAILEGANLEGANLTDVDLRGANLTRAKLTDANLIGVKYDHITSSFSLQCPEEGSFIGYKKADNKIVKLLITEDAKRSSATSRKCRCNKAKVLSITSLDGKEEYVYATSNYNSNFI